MLIKRSSCLVKPRRTFQASNKQLIKSPSPFNTSSCLKKNKKNKKNKLKLNSSLCHLFFQNNNIQAVNWLTFNQIHYSNHINSTSSQAFISWEVVKVRTTELRSTYSFIPALLHMVSSINASSQTWWSINKITKSKPFSSIRSFRQLNFTE